MTDWTIGGGGLVSIGRLSPESDVDHGRVSDHALERGTYSVAAASVGVAALH